MSLFRTFSEIEINAVVKDAPPSKPFVKLLKRLNSEARQIDLDIAREFGRELVKINPVDHEPSDGENFIRSVKVDVGAGSTIDEAAKSAIYLSSILESAPVGFDFNGVLVTATSSDEPQQVVKRFHDGLEENSRRYKAEREAYLKTPEGIAELAAQQTAAEARNRTLTTAQQIIDNTELKLKDAKGWQKSVDVNKNDPYGAGVTRFAERWAKLMQHDIEVNDKPLAEIAEKTSSLADDDGITGFMYGCAVSILAQTWEYGEQLRKWHNKDYGITEENDNGGVVNPAIITLGAVASGDNSKPALSKKLAEPTT